MTLFELFQSQLIDPIRIGLLVALVITTLRLQAATGTLLLLLAGVLFVAVILPAMQPAGTMPIATAVIIGFFANLVILAVLMGLVTLWKRGRA